AILLAALVWASVARAQSTGTPSYNAPSRAFANGELGFLVSFPDPLGVAYEGMYRTARGSTDVGIRGGVLDPGAGRRSATLAGFEVRTRLVRHDAAFPLDAAMVFGAGGALVHQDSRFTVPVGVSLGRRFE